MKNFDDALLRNEVTLYLRGDGDYSNRNPQNFEEHLYSSNMIGIFIRIEKNKISFQDLSIYFREFIDDLDISKNDINHFWKNMESFYYVLSTYDIRHKVDIFQDIKCLESALQYLKNTNNIPTDSINLIKNDYPTAVLLQGIKQAFKLI